MATAVGSLMIRRMLSLGREYQLLVGTAGDGRNSGLVDDTEDDTEDVETSDGTGVLGGLTLCVVEVGGDGDDGVGDLLS